MIEQGRHGNCLKLLRYLKPAAVALLVGQGRISDRDAGQEPLRLSDFAKPPRGLGLQGAGAASLNIPRTIRVALRPGSANQLETAMNLKLKSALGVAALLLGAQAMAQVTFYEGEGFRGRAFSTDRQVGNFERVGFNDRASSVVVDKGRWEVCDDRRFEGHCVVLRRGSYDSLRSMGLENSISSVRPLQGNRRDVQEVAAPMETPDYEYRRRPSERVFQVPVSTVRAVVGPPEQRCWIDRQQVTQQAPSQPNVGAALLGGIIGGVLGHQVGGGSGKDLATVGGVLAGAAVGNNLGGRTGGGSNIVDRDVQRCETTQNTTPAYYDVTYNFRGMEHRVQMAAPPGTTIAVNGNGEPRQ
jgi:uncharacterized protein YcfJ